MLKPEDIAAIFEWIELLLIANLKRNLARHKDEEEQEGFTWSAWQAEKLRSVNVFRRQCKSIMDRYTDVIDSETRQLLEEQFEEGVNGAAKELEEARAEKAASAALPAAEEQQTPAENPEQGHSETSKKSSVEKATAEPAVVAEVNPEPQFFGVDKAKTEKLIEDVTNIEKQAETAALRLTDDVYRQTVNRVQLAMATGSITYEKAVDMAVADFLAQGINCIEYKDGRRVNIADYVRMVLRTTSTRAALQGKSERFKAQGYDTVLVSSYGMCSKTCLPWQGRAYINDAFTDWQGETKLENGVKFGKSLYCGKWFPLLSSAIEHGLFHPNCRHSINLYIEGVTNLTEPMDNSEIERRYKAEQAQRALEREVRKAKLKVEGSLDPADVKKAKDELREAQKNVRDHINKTNAAEGERVLVRKPIQEKIYGEAPPSIGSSTDPYEPPKKRVQSTEGFAAEVNIPAPENQAAEYTDQNIPERLKSAGVEESKAVEPEAEVEAGNVNNQSIDISEESGIIEETEEPNEFAPLPSEKVVPILREDSRDWIANLSSEETRAVKKYTKNSGDPKNNKFFARLNAMLRGDTPQNDNLNYYSGVISSAIAKFKLNHDIICYRAVDDNPVAGKNVGDVYRPGQFISSSVSTAGAVNKQFFLTILASKGSRGAYIELLSEYPKQREFLFDKDVEYNILAINGNNIILEAII